MKKLLADPGRMLSFWLTYQNYVENAMQPHVYPDKPDLEYISNRLFTKAIVYGMPIALVALLSLIFTNLNQGSIFLKVFGTSCFLVVGVSAINTHIPMIYRKLIASGAMIAIGVVLIAVHGNYGVGCVYLLTCSIFYALHFSDRFAQTGIWINVLICIGFLGVIFFKFPLSNVLQDASIGRWITYSINFLFLNILVVIMIRQTISRLERGLKTEATLHQELKNQNEKLREIAYVQSHTIRLPLTKIMALTDLIENEYKGTVDPELLGFLTHSSNELDLLIRKIVSESETILSIPD